MTKETKLKKAAHDVVYEITMFRDTTKALTVFCFDEFRNNVLLESWAIHAYNLYRFFYQGVREKKNKDIKKRRTTDIIAEDFTIIRKNFRQNRVPKKLLKNIEKKRDKQIAHLTYNRIYRNKKTKPWEVKKIFLNIEKTIAAFFNSLPDSKKYIFDPKQNKYLK